MIVQYPGTLLNSFQLIFPDVFQEFCVVGVPPKGYSRPPSYSFTFFSIVCQPLYLDAHGIDPFIIDCSEPENEFAEFTWQIELEESMLSLCT